MRYNVSLNDGWTREKIRECYRQGYSTLEVASMSGVSKATAFRWCKDIIRPRFLNIDGTIHSGMRNRYEIRGDITVIYLDNKNKEFLTTTIDTQDLEKIINYKVTWWAHYVRRTKKYYVRATIRESKRTESVFLHRFITDAPKGMVVDHFDGDTLNNRRSINLKVVTHAENVQNAKIRVDSTSGEKNVIWVKKQKKWRVRIVSNKKIVVNKDFDKFDDAVAFAKESRSKFHHYNPNKKIGLTHHL